MTSSQLERFGLEGEGSCVKVTAIVGGVELLDGDRRAVVAVSQFYQ